MTTRTLLADGEANYSTPQLPDLASWYAANGVPTVNDGGGVGTWPEHRGNGPNLVQATGGSQPLYKQTIKNTWPVLRFDGSNDYLATADYPASLPQPLTIALVVKLTVATGSPRILGGNWGSDPVIWLNANKWALYAGTVLASAGDADTNWHVLLAVFNGASSSLDVDATQVAAGNAGTEGQISLRVGVDNGGSNPMSGDLAEILVYSRALSAAEKLQVQRYLGTKYSITVP